MRTLVVNELGWGGNIVFVLLYSVCRSVSVLSCVDVIQSFTYV